MIIKNADIYCEDFHFHRGSIRTGRDDKGRNRILALSVPDFRQDSLQPETGEMVLDAAGLDLIPGLTDQHFHGCISYDLCDADPDGLKAMARYEGRCGVTQLCPATMTLPEKRLEHIVRTAADYARAKAGFGIGADKKKGTPDTGENGTYIPEAEYIGVHMEGPFIAPDRVGAQNPEYVQLPDPAFLKSLQEETDNFVRIVTIAPETEGAAECIRKLSGCVRFSVGHTTADYDTAATAFAAGAKNLTHLFNAMPGIHHRKPGPIAAGWENPHVMAEIICDGVHVHPAAIRMAFCLFGAARMILISDSTRACGMEDGQYELGGQPIFKHDHAAYLANGTLAGSTTCLYDCMRNAIRFGIPKEDAIRAATYNPALSTGILDEFGTIEIGKRANLVLAEKDGSIVRVFCGNNA